MGLYRNIFITKRSLDFDRFNKDYYKYIEDYDWIKATKNLFGPESFYHRMRENKILKYLKLYIGLKHKILDAGCGTGLVLRHLPNQSVGIDINSRHVKKAKKNAPHAKVYLKDLEKTDFNNSSFNMVVCFETLEHLLFPERAIKEFSRILKPKGIFIGSVPRKTILWKLRMFSFTHPHNEPFHREFKQNELHKLLKVGFRIMSIKTEIFGLNYFFICQKK